MITQAPEGIFEIRPDIEDKYGGDQPDGPENRKERTNGAGQSAARGKSAGKRDADQAKAHNAKTDEGVIDPEKALDEWRQCCEMRAQVHGAGHQQTRAEETEMQKPGELEKQNERVGFHVSFQLAPMACSIGRMTFRMNAG